MSTDHWQRDDPWFKTVFVSIPEDAYGYDKKKKQSGDKGEAPDPVMDLTREISRQMQASLDAGKEQDGRKGVEQQKDDVTAKKEVSRKPMAAYGYNKKIMRQPNEEHENSGSIRGS